MNCFHKPLSYVFILTILFSLIMFGHTMSIYSYFGAPPPTVDFERGQLTLTISTITTFGTCIFALFVIQMDLESLIIGCLTNASFVVALITSIIAIYSYRDSTPDVAKVKEYTVKYYKNHGKPPPFLDSIQRRMNGFCCGAASYEDYILDSSLDYFDVPASCCFQYARDTDFRNCGKRKYKYLYIFLNSIMKEALGKVERDYSNLDDLGQVQHHLATQKAPEFVKSHFKSMINDRVNTILRKSNKTNADDKMFKAIQEKEEAQLAPGTSAEIFDERVKQRVYQLAQQEIDALKKQIRDLTSITFVPMGCWTLMEEMRFSSWKGFRDFQILRDKVTGIFEGVLGMCCTYFVFLLIAIVIFNVCLIKAIHFGESSDKKLEVDDDLDDEDDEKGEKGHEDDKDNNNSDGKGNGKPADGSKMSDTGEDTEDDELKKLISHSNSTSLAGRQAKNQKNSRAREKDHRKKYQPLSQTEEESESPY